MPEPMFTSGDKAVVGPRTKYSTDMQYSEQSGTIKGDPWLGAGGEWVYSLHFDQPVGYADNYSFFESDLLPGGIRGKIEALKKELAELIAQEELEKVDQEIRELPVGSNVYIKPTLYTKVDEDKWRWYHIDHTGIQYHSHSKGKTVANDIKEARSTGGKWEIFPANED